ncbi:MULTISPECIES: sensor histidine kinase [unclassified Luteococcus]|uniref:sensor histidine kinase n=1 Tax=unclassified Luteococcus TaxID=2639923 RepID=UPI00313F13C3
MSAREASTPASRQDLERWLRRLRLLSIVVPVAFVAALPLLWPSTIHVIAGLVGALAVVVFSRVVFALLERGYSQLVTLQDRALAAERHSAVLEERERIAREMHDSLAQVLSVAHLKLRSLECDPELAGLPQVRGELGELADLCQESCRDVREAILGLREAGRADRGFIEGIERFLSSWSRSSGIPAELSLELADDAPTIPSSHELQLSRVVQEALTNVRKHSGASHARVLLRADGGHTRVEVRDDGRGFDPSLPGRQDSYGLHTMRERVEDLGGRFSVASAPGEGTRVVVDLPRDEAHTPALSGRGAR